MRSLMSLVLMLPSLALAIDSDCGGKPCKSKAPGEFRTQQAAMMMACGLSGKPDGSDPFKRERDGSCGGSDSKVGEDGKVAICLKGRWTTSSVANADNGNKYYFSASRAQGAGYVSPVCEFMIMAGLFDQGKGSGTGNANVAQRCEKTLGSVHDEIAGEGGLRPADMQAEVNLESAFGNVDGMFSFSAGGGGGSGDSSDICADFEWEDANDSGELAVACAYKHFQRRAAASADRKENAKKVIALCRKLGVVPPMSFAQYNSQMNAGLDIMGSAGCGYRGGPIVIQKEQSPWYNTLANSLLGFSKIALPMAAMSYSSHLHEQNAKRAMKYNYKLGYGNIVTAGSSGLDGIWGRGGNCGGFPCGGGYGGGYYGGGAACGGMGIPPYGPGVGCGRTGGFAHGGGGGFSSGPCGAGIYQSAYCQGGGAYFPPGGMIGGIPGPIVGGGCGGGYAACGGGYMAGGGGYGYSGGGHYGGGFGGGYGGYPGGGVGFPGPYGTAGGGNGWGGPGGYPGGYPGGGFPGPYGTAGGGNGWNPYGGQYGAPYMGPGGGFDANAAAQQAQYYQQWANQMAVQARQSAQAAKLYQNSLQDTQKALEKSYQAYNAYSAASSGLSGGYGYGGGGYGYGGGYYGGGYGYPMAGGYASPYGAGGFASSGGGPGVSVGLGFSYSK